MISQEKIDRINTLARKKKAEGLNEAELAEQAKLRQEYLADFRKGFSQQVEAIKVVDSEGNELTPKKVKEIQARKGLFKNKD
ncbi:DUF896 domain-containing protein [Eremococcus coleocola]|uniref:UPF0291 protein HMPREF9257_0998 n=1 Tax=Eremococcus coleocola ACS-139-V-Col8 TaxID=908337 RepID=E4KM15_9LACT|nr:DUF896 domain-containing protein [Eremococcus coleocola]EFR31926.1 hypothetical protein HMPREF9257_0998 [Eremococcus coleocola ACS-139-V-Col8]